MVDLPAANVIETERIIIRSWRVQEADRFFDIYRRPDVVQWLGASPLRDRSEAVDMIERGLAGLAEDSRLGSWAIIDRETSVPAGSILLKPLPNGDGEIEIGWRSTPTASDAAWRPRPPGRC